MKVIWTSKNVHSEGYITAPSLIDVLELANNTIDVLVFDGTNETIDSITRVLLSNKVLSVVYINENPLPEISSIVIGKGGRVLDDTYYLENLDLIDSVAEDSESALELFEDHGDLTVIRNFQEQINNGKTDFSSKYLSLLIKSSEQLANAVLEANSDKRLMLEAGVTIMQNLRQQFNNISNTHQREKEELLRKVEEKLSKVDGPVIPTGQGVYTFPEVYYKKQSKGIVVKEIGNVPYLTSFMMGLVDYLVKVQYKKARLVVILPPGENYEILYTNENDSSRKFINFSNENQSPNYRKNIEVAFTNYPTQSVMDKLITSDFNINIILDRRTSSPKPYYRKSDRFDLTTFYAVQSESVFESFKKFVPGMRKNNSFSSIQELNKGMFSIPVFEEYARGRAHRIEMYREACSGFYDMLLEG